MRRRMHAGLFLCKTLTATFYLFTYIGVYFVLNGCLRVIG
jgi:uncharacterized membrane protein HdeD (DUF308 family)